jgi:glycolate oxidase
MGTLDALPEITRAVKGQVPVWIDGGFCRGTDIVKAKILGADVVGLGRLQCWALAAGGIAGAVRMLELLEIEIKQCMSLLGMTDWASGDPAMLQAAPVVTSPGVYSAFPLLDTRSADWY